MPLLTTCRIDDLSAYAVWNIQESFFELPYLSSEPFPANINPIRQAEWIVGRTLIKILCDQFKISYKGIQKNERGKPFLIDNKANISICHSFPIAASMIHLTKPCGIDMECPRDKHFLAKEKYLHPSEKIYQDDLNKLCAIWCAKEVIYKIYDRKFLSFANHLKITFNSEGQITGHAHKNEEKNSYNIKYEWIKKYLLAYGIENNK